ncbi:MAG: ABC transporter ATP-binding protein [Bacteroidaceae bacterium]|nr:ABC transporter ATP-binding protein [Bacteroidaceae bacterium]
MLISKSNIQWLWTVGKSYRLQALLNTLLGILIVGADLLFVWSTKLAVDIATKANTSVTLSTAFMLLAGVILLQIILGIASRWVKATLGVKSLNRMHSSFFHLLLNSDWRKLRGFHTGDLTNRLQRDASEVTNFLTESLPTLVTTLIKFTAAFVFLYVMDSMLALLLVVILPMFILMGRLYVNKMRAITHNVRTSESSIQSLMQESLQHTPVIKTLQQVPYVVEKLLTLQKKLRGEIIQKTKYSTFTSTLLNIGFASGYFLTFAWGTYSLSQGNITYGTLIAFVQLVAQIQDPVRTLTRFIPIFISVGTSCDRLREIASLPAEPQPLNDVLNEGVGIRIQNLNFAYDENSRQIFTDYSLTLSPGSRIAIMGETGTGKTTLIRLLLSLISPNSGTIELFNAQRSLEISPASRSHFAYLPQGNTLLSGTIRENLLLGNPEATEEEMLQALETACATFVSNLPNGIDTSCTEHGGGFSEGQAQRICIARTLLRKAPILLLDEATSALDATTERTVIENIIKSRPNHTLIFITHRPEVTNLCDTLVKL